MKRDDAIEQVDTLVIGAGQAGLAAGYYLSKTGRPFLLLDANERIGDQWRSRYESLRLFSPARWDGLPGLPFPAPGWSYPTGRQMADYVETYAASMGLPVRTSTRVDRLMRVDDGSDDLVAVAGDCRFRARQVIVATGAFSVPKVPSVAGQLDPSIRQLHSSQYRKPSLLADGPVLIVGVGHSGADIAYETAATHRTFLSGASHGELPFRVLDTWRARLVLPILGFFEDHVITIRTPMGRKVAARSRVVPAPLVRVRGAELHQAGVERHQSRLAGATEGKPTLDDGTVLDVTNIIWATGFRPDYGWIELPVTGADGWPIEDRGVSPEQGVYFVGVPFQFGLGSILIHGAAKDAKYVVDRIERRVEATVPAGRTEAVTA